jgi:DNA polymerase elongation subunit (family B)
LKILLIDIETSPNIAHVWGLFKQNIGLNQIMETGEVICWAAKWLNEPEVFFASVHHDGKEEMVMGAHALLEEADVVVHYNGERFDIPHLNTEFAKLGLMPPASFKQIDLYKTVKQNFRFASNKLAHVAEEFKIGSKVKHEGHTLWVKCMAGVASAWKDMREYNIQDTALLEDLYFVLLPWLRVSVNAGLYGDTDTAQCPHCASDQLHKRGFSYTSVSKFQRYQCQSCGAWSRGRKNVLDNKNRVVREVR